MALSMKERNDKRAEKKLKRLKAKTLRKRDRIVRKYKNKPPAAGMDGAPIEKELGDLTKWFGREVKRIKAKYNVE